MAIEGVPQPEKVEKKDEAENAGDKVASVVSEAAEAAKKFVADTDDAPVHEEL